MSRRSQFLLAVNGTLNADFKNDYGVKRFTGSSGELWFRQFCFVTRFEQTGSRLEGIVIPLTTYEHETLEI